MTVNRSARTPARSVRRAGFTLIELVVVILMIGIIVGTAAPKYTEYRNRVVADQASSVVGTFVALARSHALQARRAATLAVNPVTRVLSIRMEGDTIRSVNLGPGGDFEVDSLDTDMEGDTITFTARGLCTQCGMGGTGAIVVAARGRSYLVTFNALGTWKKELQ